MPPQLAFDLPVSLNKMYMPVHGTIILTQAARDWKSYASLLARSQWQAEPWEGELVVLYYFYGSRLDVDNGLKILNDALNKIVWLDDEQIVEAHIYVDRKEKKDKRVEVEIHRKAGK